MPRAILLLFLLACPAVAQQDEGVAPLHPSPADLTAPASAVPS